MTYDLSFFTVAIGSLAGTDIKCNNGCFLTGAYILSPRYVFGDPKTFAKLSRNTHDFMQNVRMAIVIQAALLTLNDLRPPTFGSLYIVWQAQV